MNSLPFDTPEQLRTAVSRCSLSERAVSVVILFWRLANTSHNLRARGTSVRDDGSTWYRVICTHATAAAELGTCTRTVLRAVADLRAAGILITQTINRPGQLTVHVHHLNASRLLELSTEPEIDPLDIPLPHPLTLPVTHPIPAPVPGPVPDPVPDPVEHTDTLSHPPSLPPSGAPSGTVSAFPVPVYSGMNERRDLDSLEGKDSRELDWKTVQRIVGEIETPPGERLDAALAILADLHSVGFADNAPETREALAAAFWLTARNRPTDPAAYFRTVWRNRAAKPPENGLCPRDRALADRFAAGMAKRLSERVGASV